MQVFLTGGTGYIGSAVLDALLRAGHRVTAIVRDPEKAERVNARGATAMVAELSVKKSYAAALDSADAVVHTAFESSPRGVEKDSQAIDTLLGLLKGASGTGKTFIYTSGVWVLGGTTRPADEESPLDPAEHVA